MAIEIRCSGCGRLGHVPDAAAGRKTRCPACQTIIPVPDIANAELFEDDDLEPLESSSPPPPPSKTQRTAEFIPLDSPGKPAPKPTLKPLSSFKPPSGGSRRDEELELDDAPAPRPSSPPKLKPLSKAKSTGKLFDDLESDDLGEEFEESGRSIGSSGSSGKSDSALPIVLAVGGIGLALAFLIGVFSLISKAISKPNPQESVASGAPVPKDGPAESASAVNAPPPSGYPGGAPSLTPPPSPFAANEENRAAAQAKNFNAGAFNGDGNPGGRPGRPQLPGLGSKQGEAPPISAADWDFAADPAPAVPASLTQISPKLSVAVPSGVFIKSYAVFPATPSPFMMTGGSRHDDQEWATTDLTTGKSVGKMVGKVAVRPPFALHPDGETAAMAMEARGESGVGVFATKRGNQIGLIPTGRDRVRFLEFGPGTTVAFVTESSAQVWDYKSKKRIGGIGLERNPFRKSNCALSGGRKHFAVVDKETIKIINVETGATEGQHSVSVQSGGARDIVGIAFSPDGESLSVLHQSFSDVALRTWSRQGAPESSYNLTHLNLAKDLHIGHDDQNGPELQWLPDGSGWLVLRQAIVERKSGQAVWTLPFDGRDQGELVNGPRKILHQGLAMVPHKIGEQVEIRAYPLPKDQIANGIKLASQGENAAEAALPPTIKTDLSAAPKVASAASPSWTAKPDPAPDAPLYAGKGIPLTARWGEIERVAFSSPAAGKALAVSLPNAAVWMKPEHEARREASSRRIEILDLKTGVREQGFDFAAGFEAIALSPGGGQFLTWDTANQNRIDVHNAQSGSHVVGFRPYAGFTGLGQQVVWADFLDDNRILTLNSGGLLVLWSLPDGKALSQSEVRTTEAVEFSPGRSTIAFADRNRLVLADAATGAIQGTLILGIGSDSFAKGLAMAFRPDGAELSVVANRKLIVVDVASGQIKATYPVTISEIKRLQYCGPYFLLINGDHLFDFVKKSQIWQYQGMAQHAARSPNQAHWYIGRGGFEGAKLGSIAIPDPALTLTLQLFADPKTQAVVKSGQSVGLRVEMNGAAGDAAAMQKGIETSFASRCQAVGLTYDPNAQVRYVIRLSERATGKNREYRMMGFGALRGGPQTLSIPDRRLDGELLLEDGRGAISLHQSSFDTPFFSSVRGNDQGSIDNELREQLWKNGESWASGVTIPYFVMRTANKPLTLPGLSAFPDL